WSSSAGAPAGGALNAWANALFFPDPVTTPIMHDDIRVGTIRLWGNASGVGVFGAAGLAGALGCLALTAAVAMCPSRRLQRTIVEPLRTLAEVTHTVRRDRAFNRRVPPAPIAELTELAEDFNALLGELETWQDSLRSENASLTHLALHDGLTGLPNR